MCADSASGAAEGALGQPSAHGLELDKDIFVHTIDICLCAGEVKIYVDFSSLYFFILLFLYSLKQSLCR